MARRNDNIPGQLSFDTLEALPMSLKGENWVVQSNDLIMGKQGLKLNSAKLIRAAIMQIKPDEEELKPYTVTIPQLSEMFGINRSNLHRDIDKITDDIFKNPVYIKSKSGKWIKFAWVTVCEYDPVIGITIKLNNDLKPFLLDLKEKYTQYRLENILDMKSPYAIRIYELLNEKLNRPVGSKGADIELTVQEIRDACDLQDKYTEFKHLKDKVIDKAESEINRCTFYHISHEYIKNGRSVIALRFHVERFK